AGGAAGSGSAMGGSLVMRSGTWKELAITTCFGASFISSLLRGTKTATGVALGKALDSLCSVASLAARRARSQFGIRPRVFPVSPPGASSEVVVSVALLSSGLAAWCLAVSSEDRPNFSHDHAGFRPPDEARATKPGSLFIDWVWHPPPPVQMLRSAPIPASSVPRLLKGISFTSPRWVARHRRDAGRANACGWTDLAPPGRRPPNRGTMGRRASPIRPL